MRTVEGGDQDNGVYRGMKDRVGKGRDR